MSEDLPAINAAASPPEEPDIPGLVNSVQAEVTRLLGQVQDDIADRDYLSASEALVEAMTAVIRLRNKVLERARGRRTCRKCDHALLPGEIWMCRACQRWHRV